MGIIARTVTSRVVDDMAVRLAGATEHAIDEIVRRRSDAIRVAVEVERLRHPDVAPRDLARLIVYQRAKLSAVAGAVSSLPGAFPGVGTAATCSESSERPPGRGLQCRPCPYDARQ